MSGLTKILIVLQLVFSVALSVLLVLMVSKQENYKTQVDAANAGKVALQATITHDQEVISSANAAIAAKDQELQRTTSEGTQKQTQLMSQIADLQQRLAAAQSTGAQQQTNIAGLTTTVSTTQDINKQLTQELTNLRPQVADLMQKNAELNRAINDATNQNRAAEQAIRRLQEEVAAAQQPRPTGNAPAGQGDQSRVTAMQAPQQINGSVSDVGQAAGRTLIQTELGTRDGVKVNTRFSIFRDNKYVGDAVVERVTPNQSVAVIVTTKPGESVQKGDIVQSGQ